MTYWLILRPYKENAGGRSPVEIMHLVPRSQASSTPVQLCCPGPAVPPTATSYSHLGVDIPVIMSHWAAGMSRAA